MEESSSLIGQPSEITQSSVTAKEINEAHEDVVRFASQLIHAGNDFISRAAKCGKLMLMQKAVVGYGGWLPWLASNCPNISHDIASDYMKLAANFARVRNSEGITSLRKAIAMLDDKQNGEPKPQETVAFAIRFVMNVAADKLDSMQRRALFEESMPLLQPLEAFGFIEIKA